MLFMAWSPVRRTNAGRFEVDHPGDYATFNSYHPADATTFCAYFRFLVRFCFGLCRKACGNNYLRQLFAADRLEEIVFGNMEPSYSASRMGPAGLCANSIRGALVFGFQRLFPLLQVQKHFADRVSYGRILKRGIDEPSSDTTDHSIELRTVQAAAMSSIICFIFAPYRCDDTNEERPICGIKAMQLGQSTSHFYGRGDCELGAGLVRRAGNS
jgi:hypothetical protein